MKLLTSAVLKAFEKQGDCSEKESKDVKVIAKFFNPQGAGTWYATEYNPTERIFFGFVSIFGDYNDELGYFSLNELESFRGRLGLGIERDKSFDIGECSLEEIINGKRP